MNKTQPIPEIEYTAYLEGSLRLDSNANWWHEGTRFKNAKLSEFFHKAITYFKDENKFYIVVGKQRASFTYDDTALFVYSFNAMDMAFALNNSDKWPLDDCDLSTSNSKDCLYLVNRNAEGISAKFLANTYQDITQYLVNEDTFKIGGKEFKICPMP